MPKNDKNTFLKLSLCLVSIIMLLWGCAAMQTPDGGPKDTTPPKVLKILPENLSTNFNSKKITIDFDEYVKLNNEFKEFSISPETEKLPELKIKGRKLEITLPDSLELNTTYTLNFGKSIVDLNEANELKNFTYVFATGPTLDSLSISGSVTNALTGDAEIEALVFALPIKKDSLLGIKRPSIYTLTDSSGNFKLKNLKKDTYKIYGLKEKSGDKIYQQVSDEIAFYNKPVLLEQNVDSIRLSIFKEAAPEFRVLDRKFNQDGSMFFSFNKALKKPEIKVLPDDLNKNKQFLFSKNKDSVTLWLNDLSFDSIKVVLIDEEMALDTIKFTRGKRDTYTRNVSFTDNLDGGTLNPFKNLTITFNLPLKSLDESKIILMEDSIPRTFELLKDSINFLKYHIKYKWRAKENYILLLKEGAATAIFDAKNKEITRTFTLGDANNYGTLSLTVETPDSAKAYVLEIVDKDKKLINSYPITKKSTVRLSNYKQGIYFARVAYDDNKNGIWDTGNVKEGRQAEAMWYEPQELSIRANWDREATIKIPLVAPLPIARQQTKPPSTDNPNTNKSAEPRGIMNPNFRKL